MRTAVMRRDDLQVLHAASTVALLVFHSCVRELDVAVAARQLVLPCPVRDRFSVTLRSTVAVAASAVVALEKALILGLEFHFKHDPPDPCASIDQTLLGLEIRRMNA